MNLRFSLHLERVHCRFEQVREPGRDEIRLFGFGLPRLGQLFFTGYRSLGSWSEGDDRSTGLFPLLLHQQELPQVGSEVLFHFWLVEEDTGGVADAAPGFLPRFRDFVQDEVRQLTAIGFPRECIPFSAFLKAAPRFQPIVDDAASHTFNSDDVFTSRNFVVSYRPSGIAFAQPSVERRSTTVAKGGGTYDLFFRATYEPIPTAFQ